MDQYLNWLYENAAAVTVSTIIVLCIAAVFGAVVWDRRSSIQKYLEHRREVRIQRGLLMGKKKKADRLAYLKGRWGDGITEFGENEFLEGRQTREEVNAFYRAIGKTHNIPDLVPVMTNAQLKSAIKGRRSRGGGITAGPAQDNPAWGTTDDQPKTATANVINATKRFGEKALKRLKTG